MTADNPWKVKYQIFGFWCAAIFSLLIAVGWPGIAHFWSPAPADLSAEATKAFFTIAHRDGMLLGNSILIVGTAFLVPASIQFGLTLSELEGPQPLWSITTAVSGCFIALIVFLNAGFWIGAAYRREAGADVVVALNDTAWSGFLLGWVFLSLEIIATALVALSDTRHQPMIPHSLSKVSIVGAVLLVGRPGLLQEWTVCLPRMGGTLYADGDLGLVAECACVVHGQVVEGKVSCLMKNT